MGDLYLGLLILAAASAAAFGFGRAAGRRVSVQVANRLSFVAVATTIAYIGFVWDQTLLVRWFPYSNLIVIGNLFPIEASFLGGLAWTQRSMPSWRRGLTVALLHLAAVLVVVSPLLGTAPQCGNAWSEGVCLQTTRSTCSAASAATLLEMHGIHATEQEMADLCLTRRGTNWMGLYRGLKKKTAGTDWDVEVFTGSADELRSLGTPAILSVGLERVDQADSFFQTELGWRPGMRHSVVLFKFVVDLVEVGEPTPDAGRERWTINDLHEVYLGQGMRLIRRVK